MHEPRVWTWIWRLGFRRIIRCGRPGSVDEALDALSADFARFPFDPPDPVAAFYSSAPADGAAGLQFAVPLVRRIVHATPKNRDRLVGGAGFLQAVRGAPLLSDEHFSVDGTLIEAWASMKSFRTAATMTRRPGAMRSATSGRAARERDPCVCHRRGCRASTWAIPPPALPAPGAGGGAGHAGAAEKEAAADHAGRRQGL